MKKLLALALSLVMVVSLAACGGGNGNGGNGNNGNNGGGAAASNPSGGGSSASGGGEVAGLTEPIAESPILLTSGGQSADYQMIGTVMKNLGMDYEINNLATSADLGGAKTLIVVVGGSSKGLGAAGIDANGELSRLDELMSGAKDAGLTIIAMHTGGNARRGDLSDSFITPCFEKADYAIVVAAGDEDHLMADICANNGIPVDIIAAITDVTTVLPAAFK